MVYRIDRNATNKKEEIKPWAEGTAWVKYESSYAAGEALKVNASGLTKVAGYKNDPAMFDQVFNQAGGYKAKFRAAG